MKSFMRVVARVAYWLLWPFWLIYFRVVPNRSRVFVVCGDEVLLLRTWLGDMSWGTPGGGAKRGEPVEESAVRELNEEVGIDADKKQLQLLGSYRHNRHGIKYQAHFFSVKLDNKPEIKRQKHEISETGWFGLGQMENMKLNDDTRHGIAEFASTILIQ